MTGVTSRAPSSAAVLRNAALERRVAERGAKVRRRAAGRDAAAGVEDEPATRREQAPARPVELTGHNAWNGRQPPRRRPLRQSGEQGCSIGMMRIGEEAAGVVSLHLLAGVLDDNAAGGLGDDAHVMGDLLFIRSSCKRGTSTGPRRRRERSTRCRCCARPIRRPSCASRLTSQTQLEELIADGILVSTPAGSTAYNLSANGPILPLGVPLMALTPLSPFRPRRWRGALLRDSQRVTIEVMEADKRPVAAAADHFEIRRVVEVDVAMDKATSLVLLHDPGHSLDERILREQFRY